MVKRRIADGPSQFTLSIADSRSTGLTCQRQNGQQGNRTVEGEQHFYYSSGEIVRVRMLALLVVIEGGFVDRNKHCYSLLLASIRAFR